MVPVRKDVYLKLRIRTTHSMKELSSITAKPAVMERPLIATEDKRHM